MKTWHVVVIAGLTMYAYDLFNLRAYLPGIK